MNEYEKKSIELLENIFSAQLVIISNQIKVMKEGAELYTERDYNKDAMQLLRCANTDLIEKGLIK